ncbi:MAG: TerB family tellurite resistance protein [Pseudomonadota bacterium]|nr:TerB family tellurite resistance protein [Pseudomonadota bacterium]
MLKRLRDFFSGHLNVDQSDPEHRVQLASAALLVEMQRADHRDLEHETEALRQLLSEHFDLDAEETEGLIELARDEVDAAVSLHEFTALLNSELSSGERNEVLELLWRTAYADGELHKQEEGLMRKIADLLYIPHSDFIQIKLRVMDELS